jgi:exopolysaccharide/PEP-CTERM locus tyrosine autokinase
MSRIEEAMEKAGKLAARQNGRQAPDAAPEKPRPAQAQSQTQERTGSEPIDMASRRLVAANQFNLPIAEEYRKLKSTIVQLIKKQPSENMLLVTSSIGGEGKSMTALNLAISLAQEHSKQVLLIDADLRKPSVASYLGLTADRGLSEYLLEDADLDDLIMESGVRDLLLLPAGASQDNPVELYSSPRMKALLERIKERFSDGYIIIDSSPVLPFAEARILATLTDGTIYVIKEGGTSLKNIEAGLNALYDANIMGLVYNKASTASLAGGYHYYYYDYNYNRRNEARLQAQQSWAGRILARFRKPKPSS